MRLQCNLYSQRDPRWSGILLGDNKSLPYTLGNFGCLVTCFSSYIGKTPAELNTLLKNNSAFVSGGLFVWSKSAVLGLNQIYVSPKYTGPVTDQGIVKLKELLDQGHGLVTEVDFNPNTTGEEMHFVLVIGYEGDSVYAMDPWVGEIINLNVYGGIKRAIIQFRAYDKKLPNVDFIAPSATSAPVGNPEQPIIDGYLALTGEFPNENEKRERLRLNQNHVEFLKSLTGDQRFYNLYVTPHLIALTDDLTNLKLEYKRQSDLLLEKDKTIEELNKQLISSPETPPVSPDNSSDGGQPNPPFYASLISYLSKFFVRKE